MRAQTRRYKVYVNTWLPVAQTRQEERAYAFGGNLPMPEQANWLFTWPDRYGGRTMPATC